MGVELRDEETGEPPGGPAGIKTFLVADVRGYTTFTQERGDEAAAELAARFAESPAKRSTITAAR